MGANPGTLRKAVAASGGVPGRHLPHLALAWAAALLRFPFSALERRRARRVRREVPLRPPLFIVGHWRSGTTHLYNLLARDPAVGFVTPFATALPWDVLLLVRRLEPLLARALPADRFVDPMAVERHSPQEDETAMANMQTLSVFHAVYFPARFRELFERGVFLEGCTAGEVATWRECLELFLRKLTARFEGRPLVVKNPVYTARVGLLREAFPGARFVHIHRDPHDVFQSAKGFWPAMFGALALQDYGHVDVEEVVLDAYPRMMRALVEDAAALPGGSFVEVRYDELTADPIGVCERIYGELGLDGFGDARPRFRTYLASVRGYEPRTHRYPPEDVERVEARWGPWRERWGYVPPAPSASSSPA